MSEHNDDIEATSALMAKCECGHLVMHGWHLKYGCQFEDCSCSLGAGGALLASDWLAEHDARAKAEALLDAARGVRNYPPDLDLGDAPARGDWWIRQAVGAWLENRAARRIPPAQE